MTKQSDPMETPEFLTEAELAKRWRIDVRTLYGRRRAGKVPKHIRVGRQRRYRLSDIIDFENELLEQQ